MPRATSTATTTNRPTSKSKNGEVAKKQNAANESSSEDKQATGQLSSAYIEKVLGSDGELYLDLDSGVVQQASAVATVPDIEEQQRLAATDQQELELEKHKLLAIVTQQELAQSLTEKRKHTAQVEQELLKILEKQEMARQAEQDLQKNIAAQQKAGKLKENQFLKRLDDLRNNGETLVVGGCLD